MMTILCICRGAIGHITSFRVNLEELHLSSSSQGIMTASGKTHLVQGSNSSSVQISASSIKLSNVKYVSNLKKSLIS